jgi:hypothetical protein
MCVLALEGLNVFQSFFFSSVLIKCVSEFLFFFSGLNTAPLMCVLALEAPVVEGSRTLVLCTMRIES